MSFSLCPRSRIAIRFALIVTFTAAPAFGQSDQALSLDESLQIAIARSSQIVSTDAQVRASREMAVSAGQLPDPVLKFGVNNVPVDGADRFNLTNDFMAMRSVGVMQEFPREEKRKARAERFEREAEFGAAQRDWNVTTVRRDTALAWLDRSYQESMRTLLEAQTNEAMLQVEAAETAYRAARGSRADIFAARSQVEQIRDRIDQTSRQVATATTQLSRWVGEAASRPLSARSDLDKLPVQAHELELQLSHHPQLAILEKQEAMAVADAKVAQAGKRPDWSWEVMYNLRGPSFSNLVSINVAIPLQWDQKNRQDREVAAKLAQVEQIRSQREDERRMRAAEIRSMIQEWTSNRARLERFDRSLIPLARERTRATLTAYRSGSGPLSAVLEARRNEIDTRTERLRLEMDTARIGAQFAYLMPIEHGFTPSNLRKDGR